MDGGSADGPTRAGPVSQGYPDTPEGSEVDELEYANSVAERLFFLARTSQVKERPYQRCASWLDTIPGAGEYFRCPSMEDYSEEQCEMWKWQGAWSKEHVAQHLQSKEPGWRARQWKQKKNK